MPDTSHEQSRIPAPTDAPSLNWGILAAGGIANKLADAVGSLTGSTVLAVGSRDQHKAAEFASRHGIERAYGSYAELVADPDLDVVYVASPHSHHREHALLALEAGKPVLVEKALARNLDEVNAIFAAAQQRGLFAMEAMWTRHLPHMVMAHDWVESGRLGELISVSADHGQSLDLAADHRMKNPALAGGALLDLGVYPIAFVLDFLGAPASIQAAGQLTETGVDASVVANLGYPDPATAQIAATLKTRTPVVAAINGTEARIEFGSAFYTPTTIRLIATDTDEEIDRYTSPEAADPDTPVNGFEYQAAETARCIAAGRTESSRMSWQHSRDLMAVMDEIRGQLGVVYPGEQDAGPSDPRPRAGLKPA